MADGVDTLIMGCTHYPLLSGLLQLELGPDVVLVSSAEETAKDVYATSWPSTCCATRVARRTTSSSRRAIPRRSSESPASSSVGSSPMSEPRAVPVGGGTWN